MPPAALIAVGLGAAAAGGSTGAIMGLGKSRFKPKNFGETDLYNPNAGQYGGREGLAERNAEDQRKRREAFDGHQAGWDEAAVNTSRESEAWRQQGGGSAQGMGRAAGMMEQRAMGRDLISTKVADRARRGLAGEMASQAASARGPAALALAQQNATAAGAQGMADLGAQEMIAGSQEQLAAENAMGNMYGQQGQLYGNLSGGATNSQQAANQNISTYGQNAAQASAQEHEINKSQNEAMQRQQEMLAGSDKTNNQTQSENDRANANQDWKYVEMMVGGASGAGGAGAMKGKASGGDVRRGRSYLVGEKGPEIVVPKDDGFVLTAPQTDFVRRTMTDEQQSDLRGGKSDPLSKLGIRPAGESPGSGPGPAFFESQGADPRSQTASNQFASDPKAKEGVRSMSGRNGYPNDNTHRSFQYSLDGQLADKAAEKKGTPKSFRRDTAADQRRVAQKYDDDKAAKLKAEAQRMMAELGMQSDAMLANGPAVGGRRRMGDAEASQLASDGEGMRARDNALLANGPSVGGGGAARPRMSDAEAARLMGEGQAMRSQMDAQLGAGPSVGRGSMAPHEKAALTSIDEMLVQDKARLANGVAPGTQAALARGGGPSWLDEYMAREEERPQPQQVAMGGTSDPAAKQAAYQLGLLRGQQDPAFEGSRRREIDNEMSSRGYAELTESEMRENELEDAADLRNMRHKDKDSVDLSELGDRAKSAAATVGKAGAKAAMAGMAPLGALADVAGKGFAGLGERIAPKKGEKGGTSDPRAKKLGGVHTNEVADALDKVPAVSYQYKDAKHEPDAQRPGERQVGFLTSDLKKSPVSRTIVEEGSDGMERYNGHRMQGFTYAGVQNVHERLRELEARLASAKGGSRKTG